MRGETYSSRAAVLACLALAAGITAVLTLVVRHDGAPRPPLIEVRVPATWSEPHRPP